VQIDKNPKVEYSQLKNMTNIRNWPSWKYANTVAGIIIKPVLNHSDILQIIIYTLCAHW